MSNVENMSFLTHVIVLNAKEARIAKIHLLEVIEVGGCVKARGASVARCVGSTFADDDICDAVGRRSGSYV